MEMESSHIQCIYTNFLQVERKEKQNNQSKCTANIHFQTTNLRLLTNALELSKLHVPARHFTTRNLAQS